MTTIAITQPTFLPWLGYFNLIARADICVFLDSVQFSKQSWQSRNRLRTRGGDILWLSVPVSSAHPLTTPISEIEIAGRPSNWRRKQAATIQQTLGRAPYFAEAAAFVRPVIAEGAHRHLAELNLDFITRVARAFRLEARLVRASTLPVAGRREDLLLDICRHFSATRYFSNAGSAAYLEASRDRFSAQGIDVIYQSWPHPQYNQLGEGFVSHLSCLDAIACMGVEAAAAAAGQGGMGEAGTPT